MVSRIQECQYFNIGSSFRAFLVQTTTQYNRDYSQDLGLPELLPQAVRHYRPGGPVRGPHSRLQGL